MHRALCKICPLRSLPCKQSVLSTNTLGHSRTYASMLQCMTNLGKKAKHDKLKFGFSHFVFQCQRKLTSVVHFVMPKFLLLFCLIDLKSVPVKVRLKTKVKESKFQSEKSMKNDSKN